MYVIRLHGCLTVHKSLEIFDICGINNWSELKQLEKLIQKCDVVWIGYCGWYTLVRHIKNKMIVFDKMDEDDLLVSSAILKMTLKRNKDRLVKLADLIFVTCDQFYEQLKKEKEKVYLVPNAVSQDFYTGTVSYEEIQEVKKFGYVGTISEWFDLSVIEGLLRLNPEYEIYLAGRNYLKEIVHPRVHYLGIRKNRELPGIIQAFDICLYNFKQTSLLDTINPVKIYEYLSLNKPVLAVKSKETWKLREYLMIYENMDQIKSMISDKVKRPFSDSKELQSFLDQNSWIVRAEKIEMILKEERNKRNYDQDHVRFWNQAGGR